MIRVALPKEYWLVDPTNQSVEVHLFASQQYEFKGVFTKEDTISVLLFPDLTIDLNEIINGNEA